MNQTSLWVTYQSLISAIIGAASIEICCLLDKPCNRRAEVHPKYVGFTVGDEFVIGYGLDYNELYRNLPYIGVFKKQ